MKHQKKKINQASLKHSMSYIKKGATVLNVNGSEIKTYPFVLTSEDIDRDRERVIIAGMNIDNYLKNPVVFLQHYSHEKPIGTIVKIVRRAKQLIGYVHFHGLDEDSKQIERYVEAGVYNAGSIGFNVLEKQRVGTTPAEREQTGAESVTDITKSELLEFSIVTIPANPNAVQLKALLEKETEAKKKGILDMDDNVIESYIEKVGATLNRSNFNKLKQAEQLLNEVIASADKGDKGISELEARIEALEKRLSEQQEEVKKISLKQFLETRNLIN